MFDETDRPDRVGVVYRFDGIDSGARVFTVWETYLGARYEEPYLRFVERVRKQGLAAFVIVGPRDSEVQLPDGGTTITPLKHTEEELLRVYREGGDRAVDLMDSGLSVDEAIRRAKEAGS